MIEVRAATDGDDLAAAGRLVQEAYFAVPGYPRHDEYDESLRDVASRMVSAVVLLALRAGEIVGCATYVADHDHPQSEHDDPDAATFRAFAVSPSAQGAGVGAAMLDWITARARTDGKRRVRLHTLECMQAAQALYQRAGYRRDPASDEEWDGVVGLAFVTDVV